MPLFILKSLRSVKDGLQNDSISGPNPEGTPCTFFNVKCHLYEFQQIVPNPFNDSALQRYDDGVKRLAVSHGSLVLPRAGFGFGRSGKNLIWKCLFI